MKIERFLSQHDAAILSRLAERLLRLRDVNINFAEKLVELIATSMLVPQNDATAHAGTVDYVTLSCRVTYRPIGTSECHAISIVCPNDANVSLAQVSILAPLAMALIGRRLGSIVEVSLPFSQVQFIEITAIEHGAMEQVVGLMPHFAGNNSACV